MEKQNQKEYALADTVLRIMIKKNEKLKLHPRASEGFKLAMDALFAHPTLDPKEEIEALVRLGWLFERDQVFDLADEIIDLMAKDERALSVLGISAGGKTREAKNQFAKLVSGSTQKLAAPVFGKEAPQGSMKVSSFLEPGREMGRNMKPTPTKPKTDPKRRI